MTKAACDLSVVIVSWNVVDLLRICLRSIYAHTRDISLEVFVVDNASADASAAMVAGEFPQVRLIANKTNRGFAAANNQALRQCAGRYSLLLNPDTQLMYNVFKEMVSFLDLHPEYAALAPRLTFADGSLQHSCRPFPSFFTDLMESLYLDGLFPHSAFFNRHKMGYWAHDRLRRVDQAYGACLMLRSDMLRQLDYFDERFFLYYDEIDLCYRLKRAGGRLVFVPDISVVHHSNRSSRQIPAQTHRWRLQSHVRFFRKHFGAFGMAVLFVNLLLRTLVMYAVLGPGHVFLRRPRDWEYFASVTRSIWQAYLSETAAGGRR